MKGQAFADHAIYGIYILIAIIILVVSGLLFVIFNDTFPSTGIPGADDITQLKQDGLNAVSGFDISVIILVVGIGVVIFLVSYLFSNSPVFFGIFLLLTFVMMLISIPVVNGVYDFVNTPGLASTMSRMPGTNFIVSNWIWVVLFYVGVSIIGFGAKARSDEYGGSLQ